MFYVTLLLSASIKKNTTMHKITIPNPCHENWDAMTTAQQGRHCNQCNKTVVDFTTWQKQDVFTYINQNKKQHICGRFTQTQLQEDLPTAEQFVKQISYFRIDNIKKVAAIFLFVFALAGTSCNEHTNGAAIEISQINTTKQKSIDTVVLLGDTILTPIIDTAHNPVIGKVTLPKNITSECVRPEVMGKIAMPDLEPVKAPEVVKPEPKIMGDIAVENIPVVLPNVNESSKHELMGMVAVKPIPKVDSINIKK